jgi:hypothetical protein
MAIAMQDRINTDSAWIVVDTDTNEMHLIDLAATHAQCYVCGIVQEDERVAEGTHNGDHFQMCVTCQQEQHIGRCSGCMEFVQHDQLDWDLCAECKEIHKQQEGRV